MRQLSEAEVVLPIGYWRTDACIREARVCAVPEADEELSAELSTALLPIQRTTALLARCVTSLGNNESSAAAVRELSLGDREALLLHIRRLTFGEDMRCVLRCSACGEEMEFRLRVGDLLMAGSESPPQSYAQTFCVDGSTFHIRFRMPTAKDVETAVRNNSEDLEQAARELLLNCVESVHREDAQENDGLAPEEWPAALPEKISERLAELDRQAEIWLQLTCPGCNQEHPTLLDTASYLLRELAERERRLYEDVHQLALAYHWSEADILKMTPRKRKLYLSLLAGEIVQ